MSQPSHLRRLSLQNSLQREREEQGRRRRRRLRGKKREDDDTSNGLGLANDDDDDDDDYINGLNDNFESDEWRLQNSLSQFAASQSQKRQEIECEVCQAKGEKNFEVDEQYGGYFCKQCNTKTDNLVLQADAEALARAMPGFGGESGPMSFHGARKRRVNFGRGVTDFSQQTLIGEERELKEKRQMRIKERRFTKKVDLHCETMTKLLRAQCEFCIDRYFNSTTTTTKKLLLKTTKTSKTEELEFSAKEKRANEFRKVCRSIWFALLATNDELFSIDMDNIESVHNALGRSTMVLDDRNRKEMKRKVINEEGKRKAMVAYGSDNDDDDGGGSDKDDEDEEEEEKEEEKEEEYDDDDENKENNEKKNEKSAPKTVKAAARVEQDHLNAVNSLLFAHLPPKLTLGALLVAARMCFANSQFGFTTARDISTLASTGKLPYLRPTTTNIDPMRAWGKDLARPRTMPTSTDVTQMAEYIVAKTGIDVNLVFGPDVPNRTRELVRRAFQTSFPNSSEPEEEKQAEEFGAKMMPTTRIAEAYCESAENLMQLLGYDFVLDSTPSAQNALESEKKPYKLALMKENDLYAQLNFFPSEVHAAAIVVLTMKLLFGLDGRAKSRKRKWGQKQKHLPDCIPVEGRENTALKVPAEGWLVWAVNARKAFQEELLRKRCAIPPSYPSIANTNTNNDGNKSISEDICAYIDWCETNVFDDANMENKRSNALGRFNTVCKRLSKIAETESATVSAEQLPRPISSLSRLLDEKNIIGRKDNEEGGRKLYEISASVPFVSSVVPQNKMINDERDDERDEDMGEKKYAGTFLETLQKLDLNTPDFLAILNWASEVCGASFRSTHQCVIFFERLLLLGDSKLTKQSRIEYQNKTPVKKNPVKLGRPRKKIIIDNNDDDDVVDKKKLPPVKEKLKKKHAKNEEEQEEQEDVEISFTAYDKKITCLNSEKRKMRSRAQRAHKIRQEKEESTALPPKGESLRSYGSYKKRKPYRKGNRLAKAKKEPVSSAQRRTSPRFK
jgi:hypothetical protein